MTTIQHPGWKEFPLSSSQPVRVTQINALWWALNERAQAVSGIDIIETNFPNITKRENSQESAASALTTASALLAAANVALDQATNAAQTNNALAAIEATEQLVEDAQADIDEASELSESEIDNENEANETEFKSNKMNIFLGCGEDRITLSDLTNLRSAVTGVMSLYIDPEQLEDENGEL